MASLLEFTKRIACETEVAVRDELMVSAQSQNTEVKLCSVHTSFGITILTLLVSYSNEYRDEIDVLSRGSWQLPSMLYLT